MNFLFHLVFLCFLLYDDTSENIVNLVLFWNQGFVQPRLELAVQVRMTQPLIILSPLLNVNSQCVRVTEDPAQGCVHTGKHFLAELQRQPVLGLSLFCSTFKIIFICLFVWCLCVCVSKCEGKKTICRSQFSSSTVWVLGIKLGSSALATSIITQ